MKKSKKRAFFIVDKTNIMHEGLVIYDKIAINSTSARESNVLSFFVLCFVEINKKID